MPDKNPIILSIEEFLTDGIVQEMLFREKLAATNWEQYRGKKVYLKGCGHRPVPIWAYLMIMARLVPLAQAIFWGEPCSAVPVYKRPKEPEKISS